VEFDPIPKNVIQQTSIAGTDYSALNTWIPGGTIAQYQWHMGAQPPFDVDPNRFVLLTSPELTTGASVSNAVFLPPAFSPLCLTITGTRISNFGSPPTYQQVSASICAYSSFPVISIGGLETGPSVSHPTLAITHAGAKGEVVVSSHVAPGVDQTGIGVPNLVVHFADAKSSTQLETLTKAIAGSHRKDAATAAMAVLTPEHLSKAPFVSGVVYAEDQDGSWLRHFGVKSAKCPLTLIVSPRGSVLWKSEGELHLENLTAALVKHLLPRRPVRSSLPVLNVRIGQRAPNFLFEYSPGHEMPITKLSGQSILLVFWKSAVKASIEAVRQFQNSSASSKSAVPVVLAVNDGDDPAEARAVAKKNGVTAIVVTDPKREISRGYGVISWPTIISVDGAGIVRGIRYGYTPVAESTPPGKKPAAKS
jgi:peroxiredoxin